ncbi:hypothetical protein [Streptomyces sp. SGAir0957]
MPDLTAGSRVNALDAPPTVYVQDTTAQTNIASTSYSVGSPEVGVTFTAPTTGRVCIKVGASMRNDAANSDRVAVTVEVFLGTSGSGTQVVAPTVFRGVASPGTASPGDYATYGNETMVTGLTPGATYYARCMHIKYGSGGTTVDLAMRDLLIKPAT